MFNQVFLEQNLSDLAFDWILAILQSGQCIGNVQEVHWQN